MTIRLLLQSRCFLLLFGLIPLLLALTHYVSRSTSFRDVLLSKETENFVTSKVLEVNDRDPSYKLAVYEGYQFPLERNRAQTELLTNLKLKEKCQKIANTTVLDIGASLGEFGFYAAACGCQVYMFEIEPKKIFFIEKSIEINAFQSRVHLIKKAVSDLKSNQTAYFNRLSSGQLSPLMNVDLKNPDIFTAETINLNHLSFSSIFILRIDVQGHELHVLRSTEKLFREKLVNHTILEYTPWGTDQPIQADIFNYMNQILQAKKFYALHPKQPIIYGPLNDQDLQQFYLEHKKEHLQRDVYALIRDEEITITASPYSFKTSF